MKDVPGWTPIDQLYTLFTLTLATTGLDGDIIEVGSWCGRSAVVLGLAARMSSRAKVICVDLFPEKKDWRQNADGSYSFQLSINGKQYVGNQVQTVWRETFETQTGRIYERYDRVIDCFRETINSRGLQDVISPHKGDLQSMLEAAGPSLKCRLAFLDGDHGYDAVCEDIKQISSRLVPGGWICFDDAFTVYQGVDRAITEHILNNPQYGLCQQMTRKLFIARKNQ